MNILKRATFALALVLCAQHAAATTVEYTFSANVAFEIRGNQLATDDQTLFTPFAFVTGSFDYDNAATGIPTADGTVYNSVFNLTGSIEGNEFSDPSGGVLVINDGLDLDPNDPNNLLTDLLAIGAEGGPIMDLTGFSISNGGSLFTLVNVRLFWINPNGGFLTDEALPGALAPQTEIARLALDFVDSNSGATHTVFGETLTLNASPVPLPAAAWLLLSGLGLLGLNRKTR